MRNTSINARQKWRRKNNRTHKNRNKANKTIMNSYIFLNNEMFQIRKKERPVMF